MNWHDGPSPEDRLDMLRTRNRRERSDLDDPDPPLLRSRDYRDGRLKTLAGRGELLRLTDGVYVEPPPREWPRWRRDRYVVRATTRAVGLSLPDSLVVGGPHAALLHGIPVLHRRLPVEVHGRSGVSTRSRRVAHRHRQRAHALDDAVTVGGIRVTNPIRTAVDCARTLDIDEALVIVNGVLDELARPVPWRRAAGDAAIAEVRARMVALLDAEPRTRGNARARLVLDIADGWAESPLESLLLRVLLLLGLPRPRLQDELVTPRFRHYPDATLTWPMPDGSTWRARFQADGRGKYERAQNVLNEREREADIRATSDHLVNLHREHLTQPGLRDATELIASVVPPHIRATLTVADRYRTLRERRDPLFVDSFPEILRC